MATTIYNNVQEAPQMFFGESRGIQEFIATPYPKFIQLQEQQKAQDWAHDEFPLKLDAAQFASANQSIKHIFTSNLQAQVFADTLQGRGPASLLPYVSDPSLELLLIEWARSEGLHSKTYSYMLTAIFPNPRIVLDLIVTKPEIFKRFTQCISAYNNFFEAPSKENLVILIAAINILEALAFYASFACNFGFANMGLFESVSKYLTLIARDENLHVAITQNIIKYWKEGKEGKEWQTLWNHSKTKIREMYIEGFEEEKVWNKYLFQYGAPITGLNEELLNNYNEYMLNKRMKNLGLKPLSKLTKDPLPWIQLKYLNGKNRQSAPQETQLTDYLKNSINKISDLEELKGLRNS